MDFTDEAMTLREMLEKISEQDHSLNQQRELTSKMKMWLDVADDDMATLRSENTSLIQQVKTLEKMLKDALKVKAEPCDGDMAIDLAVKRCSEKKIRELENETTVMKLQNKKLIEELDSLQKERDQDKISLNNFRVALQTLECGMEEAQLALQDKDEVINKKNLLLLHMEETVLDFRSTVELLRLTNQELKEKLEDRLDDASITVVNDLLGEKKAPLSPPMSFADEVKLLASSDEVKANVSDSTNHVETEADGLTEPGSVALDIQTERGAAVLVTGVQRAGLFLVSVIVFTLLAFVASGSCTGNTINTLWSSASLILQPYCNVYYGALPPI